MRLALFLLGIFYMVNAQELTLKKVDYTDGTPLTVTFESTLSTATMNTVAGYVFNTVTDGVVSNHYAGTAVEDPDNTGTYTATFTEPFPALSGSVALILHAFDIDNIELANGGITIDSFPDLPANLNNPQFAKLGTDNYILRLSATSFKEYNTLDVQPSTTKAKTDSLLYYLDVTDPKLTYSLCNVNKNGILLCCETFKGIIPPVTSIDTGSIISATLTYNDDTTASIDVVVDLVSGTNYEVIFGETIQVESTSTPMTFTDVPRGEVYYIHVIGVDTTSEVMLNYVEIPLKDYILEGQQILPTSLEMRWESQDEIHQYFIKELSGTSTEFSEATVDCNPGSAGIPCFGYFTGLSTGQSYTVSVQPGTTGPNNADDTNIIVSLPITISSTKTSELLVKLQKTNWHTRDLQLVEVCFSHANQNQTTAFSHYEFVLLNQKGQFLKHYLMTDNTEGNLCFTRFPINTADFHVSGEATLIVLQRALDGFAILASGEIQNALNV